MDRKEAAFSGQHSAISQKEAISTQPSAVSPKRFTTEEIWSSGHRDIRSSENQDLQQMNAEGQERTRQRAEGLVRRIGEACDELEKLAEENPELVGRVTYGAEEHKEAYLRLKARLALADSAPRCRWVRQDGTTCGSPQMKRHIYCFAHKQMAEAQALMLRLPALEDANAIQVGLMRIQKALIEGTISTKTAGLLLYSMQLALQNVGRTTFGQIKAQELVRDTVDEEEALTEEIGRSAHRDIRPTENQRPFAAKDAEEAKVSPLINADNTDQKEDLLRTHADRRGLGEVEWRPTPDMYRMDTPEGMEAYEASFRMKMRTRESQPGAAVPHEQGRPRENAERLPDTRGSAFQAEPRANLG
jgi:hypothetical protein